MISVGHPMSLPTSEELEIVREIEPEIILPMHYKNEGANGKVTNLEPLEPFLKESAISVERMPKLSVKISDISSEEQKIILLDVKEK